MVVQRVGTDGAVHAEIVDERSGRVAREYSTIRAELHAVDHALQSTFASFATVFTDCQHVARLLGDHPERLAEFGTPLWQKAWHRARERDALVLWIASHDGNVFTRRADELARAAIGLPPARDARAALARCGRRRARELRVLHGLDDRARGRVPTRALPRGHHRPLHPRAIPALEHMRVVRDAAEVVVGHRVHGSSIAATRAALAGVSRAHAESRAAARAEVQSSRSSAASAS